MRCPGPDTPISVGSVRVVLSMNPGVKHSNMAFSPLLSV